jgi:hypothetical protein
LGLRRYSSLAGIVPNHPSEHFKTVTAIASDDAAHNQQ